MHDILLDAKNLCRRFGGLMAVDRVSLSLARGAVHAVIGTNGAGKSTLINLLSGELAATAGTVRLHGEEVTTWPQARRARAGLGRSYQRSTLFPSLSVYENCRLAAQASRPRFWHWWARAQDCPHSTALAREALAHTGLEADAHRPAGLLPHGRKRQLEIAMCLATRPDVLLLDEPLAGMGPEETDRILALLESLKPRHAILLVEHDMDAVFRIADIITVMVNGAVIASGTPERIRADEGVRTAYLGTAYEMENPPGGRLPSRGGPSTEGDPHAAPASQACCPPGGRLPSRGGPSKEGDPHAAPASQACCPPGGRLPSRGGPSTEGKDAA